MSTADSKIAQFRENVLLPALNEVAASPRLASEYEPMVLEGGKRTNTASDELLDTLERTVGSGQRVGPSLLLSNRTRDRTWPAVAGTYALSSFFFVMADDVYASPAVAFWMRFNNKLHVFNHRYDNAVANHAIEDVTRPHIQNHILNSFDFYKIYAFADTPFPGYR
jgi:hypothetical protein